MSIPTVTIPPTDEPVTLENVKGHLRVDHDLENEYIQGLIVAARAYCEAVTWRSFATQTLELTFESWPNGARLLRPPIQQITAITYRADDDTTGTVGSNIYTLSNECIYLYLGQSWPQVALKEHSPVTVSYVAGYGGVDDIPPQVSQAIRLIVGHWYEHREAVIDGNAPQSVPLAVDALLNQLKVR